MGTNAEFSLMTRLCSCSGSSASTLEISKEKQVTEASCGTCGGRPLVDGLEHVTATMHSTLDLEPTNSSNSELNWKKVKKGYRSANRHSRKTVSKSLTAGLELINNSHKREQDPSVFESEKLSVAVLGRHISEKVADLPIKKRRLLIQSPSSPPPPPPPPPLTSLPDNEDSLSSQPETPSLLLEEPEHLADNKCNAAGKWCSQGLDSISKTWAFDGSLGLKLGSSVYEDQDGKIPEVTNGDDFSGIQLLAAAACGSNIDNNFKDAFVMEKCANPEGISASIPFKESIASSGTGDFFQKDLINEDDLVNSFVQDSTFTGSLNIHNEEGKIAKNCDSSRDERLHWDLNIVMNAWDNCGIVENQDCSRDVRLHLDLNSVMDTCEERNDDPHVNSHICNSEHVLDDSMQSEKLTLGSCEIQVNVEDARCDIENEVQSAACKDVLSDVQGHHILLDSINMVHATAKSSIEEQILTACPAAKTTSEKCVTPTESAPERLDYPVSDSVASIPVICVDASHNHRFPESCQIAMGRVSEMKVDTPASVVEQMGEDFCTSSVTKIENLLCGSFQAQKPNAFSTGTQLIGRSVFEIEDIQPKNCEDFGKTYGLCDNKTSPRQLISSLTCKTLDAANSIGESDKADHFHTSPKFEAFPATSLSVEEGRPVVLGEVRCQDDKISVTDNIVNTSAHPIGPVELLANSCGQLVSNEGTQKGEIISQGSCKSSGDGDVPTSCTVKLVPDNHSFEDGELREPGLYTWEENEVEEGETECVDYGSDYGDRDELDAVDYSILENFEVGRESYQNAKKGISLEKDDNEKGGLAGNRTALDEGSVVRFEQGSKGDSMKETSGPATLETKVSGDQLTDEHREYGNAEGHIDKGSLPGDFGSSSSRGKLPYHCKRPPPFDLLERKNARPVQRSRSDSLHYSYSRAERDIGFEKSTGRGRFSLKVGGRNEADGPWVDSSAGYRDTRNGHPHGYRGPEGHSYSRPRDAISESGVKVGGLNSHDDRRSINYSSNGMSRPYLRRRSPTDRRDPYGGDRGTLPVRGITRDRSRGRSGLYSQGVRRGPKEYHEDVPDDICVPSGRRPPYFARKEQGFSPNYNRGAHRPIRNSRSRSRTRSPVPWHLQRDHNVGPRRHSLDFRSDTRMEGPFQKSSFAAESEEICTSPPRGRLSPQSNSRWSDDGNFDSNQFRDRSPVRMFRQNQRFDTDGGYSGRVKPDGFFRPMARRGGFRQVAGTVRGCDFEGSDDERRKHDERYEIGHRIRRCDAGGAVRRFRYDDEDCFKARNSHNEDVPRSGREERVPRYKSDRMYGNAVWES